MELHYLPILDIAQRLRSGALTSLSLTEYMLARIEKYNKLLNAYITVLDDTARKHAEKADEELQNGFDRGLLHGIPIAVKDLFATKGVLTTSGSLLYQHRVPNYDATAVARLKAAGAIILGKTSMYELAAGTTGINPYYGNIHNPWKHNHDPGGSSGGSASAVAAGLAFAALGTDTGCSIRFPAHCCGIVGFKPSFGSVSKYGIQPLVWTLDHVGPLARSTEDAKIVFNAIKGYDASDGYSVKRQSDNLEDIKPIKLSGIRIGIVQRYFFECEVEISTAFHAALCQLKELGAYSIDLDIPDLDDAFSDIETTFAESAAVYKDDLRKHGDQFSEKVRQALERRQSITATEYAEAQHFRQGFRNRLEGIFSTVDVVLLPTARRVSADLAQLSDHYAQEAWKNTCIFNFTGHPSISIPCGFSSKHLPIGMMVCGPLGQDQQVLQIARAFEIALGFHREHPELPS